MPPRGVIVIDSGLGWEYLACPAQRAAAVIQRYVRRRQGYERMLNRCATKIQAAFRGHIVRDAVQAWREECAALCIQTMYRMYRYGRPPAFLSAHPLRS
jgi:hypothetical protein